MSWGVVRGEAEVELGWIIGVFLHPRKQVSRKCTQWSDVVRLEF